MFEWWIRTVHHFNGNYKTLGIRKKGSNIMNKTLKSVVNVFFKVVIANIVGYIVAQLYKAIKVK